MRCRPFRAPRGLHRRCALLTIALASAATGAPITYQIDPTHTYPSFEADHMGLSWWRGKINKSAGTIVYDKRTGEGTVEVQMDMASIDFGLPAMNAWATGRSFLQVDQHPMARYQGRFVMRPTARAASLPAATNPSEAGGAVVSGELTLNGQTRAVNLTLHHLRCITHPIFRREVCGADASGSFNREAFGLDAGKMWGFQMEVHLRIQVEALETE